MYYLRARYYDPSVGRFISEDTYKGQVDNPLTLNRYTYVSNNSLRYTDPTGHWQQGDENLPEHLRKELSRLTDNWELAKTQGERDRIHNEANSLRQGYYSNVEDPTSSQREAAALAGYYFGKTVDFGSGWSVRQDSANSSSGVQKHVHLGNKKVGKWSQNEDGSVHDEHANSPGEPPGWVRKELKKKTGWDWDKKASDWADKQKEIKINPSNVIIGPVVPTMPTTVPEIVVPEVLFPRIPIIIP